MYVTVVYVHVKPEHVADFIESIRTNHEHSVLEPGNLRFDILQSVDDPTRFIASTRPIATRPRRRPTRKPPTTWRGEEGRRLDGGAAAGRPYDGLFPAVERHEAATQRRAEGRPAARRRDDDGVERTGGGRCDP
jgi:hypothetical protein